MTINEATTILQQVGALDSYGELYGWRPGSRAIYLDGEYSADELEAIVVWMRAHEEAR